MSSTDSSVTESKSVIDFAAVKKEPLEVFKSEVPEGSDGNEGLSIFSFHQENLNLL